MPAKKSKTKVVAKSRSVSSYFSNLEKYITHLSKKEKIMYIGGGLVLWFLIWGYIIFLEIKGH